MTNGPRMCDSWMVLVCAIVAIGWHTSKSYCNKNFNCPQHCKKTVTIVLLECLLYKLCTNCTTRPTGIYVKLVHAQKLGPYSGGSRNFEKGGPAPERGGPPPEIAKNSRILGLKFLVLLTFDGKFRAKRGGPGPLGPPSKSATAIFTNVRKPKFRSKSRHCTRLRVR
jgi:hypothetical protein